MASCDACQVHLVSCTVSGLSVVCFSLRHQQQRQSAAQLSAGGERELVNDYEIVPHTVFSICSNLSGLCIRISHRYVRWLSIACVHGCFCCLPGISSVMSSSCVHTLWNVRDSGRRGLDGDRLVKIMDQGCKSWWQTHVMPRAACSARLLDRFVNSLSVNCVVT